MGLDDIKDLIPKVFLLEQVPEVVNRCLIRDLVADQIDSSKTPHGGPLNFCGGRLVIGKAKLLAAHHFSTGLSLCAYSRSDGLRFPETPMLSMGQRGL